MEIIVVYGAIYYILALTVLTQNTVFLGAMLVMLAAYTTVIIAILDSLMHDSIANIEEFLIVYVCSILWLILQKLEYDPIENFRLMLILFIVLYSGIIMINTTMRVEWIVLLAFQMTCTFVVIMMTILHAIDFGLQAHTESVGSIILLIDMLSVIIGIVQVVLYMKKALTSGGENE